MISSGLWRWTKASRSSVPFWISARWAQAVVNPSTSRAWRRASMKSGRELKIATRRGVFDLAMSGVPFPAEPRAGRVQRVRLGPERPARAERRAFVFLSNAIHLSPSRIYMFYYLYNIYPSSCASQGRSYGHEPVFKSRSRFRSELYEVTRCLVPKDATRLKHAARCSFET